VGTPDPYLVNHLAQQDIPCPGCGYNLRGLTGECCPECGQALVLRVGLAEPKMGSFLAALIALTTGLGFNFFVLMWAIWVAYFRGFPPGRQVYILLAVSLVVLGGASVLLIRRRRWLRERSLVGRVAVIVSGLMASIVSVVAFFAFVS
jgi:hypothetical protein